MRKHGDLKSEIAGRLGPQGLKDLRVHGLKVQGSRKWSVCEVVTRLHVRADT